jgi:subtilase family serine protease
MAHRSRPSRFGRYRRRPRSVFPRLDSLENRLVLSDSGVIAGGFAAPTYVVGSAPYALPVLAASPQQIIPIVGALPQQLESAYGINQVFFGKIKGTGAGQTVAIVDAYDNPGFKNTSDASFATSTLGVYDNIFGLPDPPSFTKFNESGQQSPLPKANAGWGVEIALDIETVHLMAPAASIDLVEATTNSSNDLFAAEQTAATLPGVSVVTNSWGGHEFTNLLPFDSILTQPGVTFLASSGDYGASATTPGGFYSGGGASYPATSPNIVAVGGTSLYLNSANAWSGETGWSYGSDAYAGQIASGGGISAIEGEPFYQQSVQSTNQRTVPDVAADADPTTGLAEYDPTDFGAATPFATIGGTSLASPLWAGMIAIANQGRALDLRAPLTGY